MSSSTDDLTGGDVVKFAQDSWRALDEGIGELNSRNKRRQADNEQSALDEAERQRERAITSANNARQMEELDSSVMASALRRRAEATRRSSLGLGSVDFLGL